MASDESHEGDGASSTRVARLAFALRRTQFPTRFPITRGALMTPLVMSLVILAIAIAFVAGIVYYGSGEFGGRAADTRAAGEAQSFARHSSKLATGDAFDGYIQILRYADDPVLRDRASSANDRATAMQELLYLNTNKFSSLTLADRAGIILATSDSTISTIKNSPAFAETRANLHPANSDIILPEAGHHGYVEFTAPLRDADGAVWAVLIARADPARIWKGTLDAAVDGSRNVIINNAGQFAAGVPDELLRQPWRGSPLGDGRVRADIAGVDSICGLAPIGADTQIDRGLNVASCLPASIIQLEQQRSTGKLALVTVAATVLAIVLGGLALRLARPPAPVTAQEPEVAPDKAVEPEEELPEPQATDDLPEVAQPAMAAADVDALALIEAYEQRNARLAERLREAVQARLLIAATQADEAYKLQSTDEELSASLHDRAMAELEGVRERELRSIGQDLYPGLVRLGLPNALKALRKDVADLIDVKLEIDSRADAISDGHGRVALDPALRLIMFRFAADATRTLTLAGAAECTIALGRDYDALTLSVSADRDDALEGAIDETALAASRISVEAYAGKLRLEQDARRVRVSIELPAPHLDELQPQIEPPDALEPIKEPDDDNLDPVDEDSAAAQDPQDDDSDASPSQEEDAPAVTFVSVVPTLLEDDDQPPNRPEDAAAGDPLPQGLRTALEALQAEMFGSLVVALEVDPGIDDGGGDVPSVAVLAALRDVVRESLAALKACEARKCAVSLQRSAGALKLSVTSETDSEAFEAVSLLALTPAVEGVGGKLSVEASDDLVAVTVTIATSAEAGSADAA